MLAALYDRHGDSGVLRVQELEDPGPGPGEVRVRIAVSGVNPTDYKQRQSGGRAGEVEGFQVPGQDGAGTIDAVGPGVDEGRIGERVWVLFASYRRRYGTGAQLSVVPAGHAVPLPEGASLDLGAQLGIPALTAHRCLFADGPLDGRTVLVAGGAGAVGHFAVELARRAGARVVATVSSDEKAALARAAGADAVVDYTAGDAAEAIRAAAPDGVDRVVEVALNHNLELDRAVVAPDAAIAAYADDGGAARLRAADFMARNVVVRFVLVYTMPAAALGAAIEDVSAALAEGALTPLPVHRFGLHDIAAAQDAVEGGAVGKVLVDVPA